MDALRCSRPHLEESVVDTAGLVASDNDDDESSGAVCGACGCGDGGEVLLLCDAEVGRITALCP